MYIGLDPNSWRIWKDDPVTQKIMQALSWEREEWANKLLEGDTLIPGQEVKETAKAVGIIYGLDFVLVGLEDMLREEWDDLKRKEQEAYDNEAEE